MKRIKWLAQDVGTITDFMSPQECEHCIEMSEEQGYEDAPVSTGHGMIMMKDLRNNERVMIDDARQAVELFERVRQFIPPRFKNNWEPVGVNERLRFYRYDVGQQFDWHGDGYFERDDGERSFFTFMVYLNEDFEGGATSFSEDAFAEDLSASFRVTPKKGMALLFHHPILHRGDPVIAGRKYVLRSDIMYARRNAS